MKFAKTLLIGVSSLALGTGAALAADTAKKDNDPGFNKLDTNNDGYLSRSEAAKNPYLAKRFKEADGNNDGKLSRMEYLKIMAKIDTHNTANKVSRSTDSKSASGGTKQK